MHAKGLVGLGDIVHYQFQIGSVKTDIQSCIYLAVLACMLFLMRLGTTNIWRSRVMELRIVDARRCSSVNAVLNVQTKPASMAATWKSKPLGNVSSTLMYHRLVSRSKMLQLDIFLHLAPLFAESMQSRSLTTKHSPLMMPFGRGSGLHHIPNSGEQMSEFHLLQRLHAMSAQIGHGQQRQSLLHHLARTG